MGFSTFVMETKTEHGDFDLSSGIYTIKTAGVYKLDFHAHVDLETGSEVHHFNLNVNKNPVAVSYNCGSNGSLQAVISALLPLKAGDEVGIFAVEGELFEDEDCITRFFGILLDKESTSDE